MPNDFLLVIGDREPLIWILNEQRMAFSSRRLRSARTLAKGDRLFLYTTRGCFHHPHQDRGVVIGEATVSSEVELLSPPVRFGWRSFPIGCHIEISGITDPEMSVEMSGLVDELQLFPNKANWAGQLRRVIAPLNQHDAKIIHSRLSPNLKPLPAVRPAYILKAQPLKRIGR